MEIKLYRVKEVAQMFQVAERTVYNWVAFGYLKAIKIGDEDGKGTIRITDDAIEEFIKQYITIDIPIPFHRKR